MAILCTDVSCCRTRDVDRAAPASADRTHECVGLGRPADDATVPWLLLGVWANMCDVLWGGGRKLKVTTGIGARAIGARTRPETRFRRCRSTGGAEGGSICRCHPPGSEPLAHVWQVFAVRESPLRLCDFASGCNTWDEASRYRVLDAARRFCGAAA